MFGTVISSLVVNAVKSTVKSSLRIDELINKLKENCPSDQELQKIVIQKDQLYNALNLVQTNLTTLTSVTNTIDSILPPIDTAVTFIKTIPIPTSFPPGIGVPINLITKLSDTLVLLKDLIKQGKVSIKGAQQAFKIISTNINNVQNKLNQLDIALLLCASQTGFTGSLSTGVAGVTPNPIINVNANNELENRLSSNSTNPLIYKGWRLILQTDPNNTFSFPRRRVIAQKPNPNGSGIITLISDFGPPGSNGYSYSSDTQVLVNDIQFKIDNPNWKPDSVLESIDEVEAAVEAAATEAAAAAEEARRQAEEARRGKVIFFGQTGQFENLPIGDFSGYDAGEYPVTDNAPGMVENGSKLISSVRIGRGVRITIFYNSYFLTKPGIPQNDSNLQNLSRRIFEHPFNADEDYAEYYVGDEFNDHVDSFIIDKLPGGIVNEVPSERLAIYEPTWALKQKSTKQLYGLVPNPNIPFSQPVLGGIIESAIRYDGYVVDSPTYQYLYINKDILSEQDKQRLIYFRAFNEEEAINKAVNTYNSSINWFASWNFFTSSTPENQHIVKYNQTSRRVFGGNSWTVENPQTYIDSNFNPQNNNSWRKKLLNNNSGVNGGEFYFEKIS
jgi:hypothetical protein